MPVVLTQIIIVRRSQTHIDTVHHVEQFLDAVLSLPSFSTFNLFATVLEMLGGFGTFSLLTFSSDCWCWLRSVSWESQGRTEMSLRPLAPHPLLPPPLPLPQARLLRIRMILPFPPLPLSALRRGHYFVSSTRCRRIHQGLRHQASITSSVPSCLQLWSIQMRR